MNFARFLCKCCTKLNTHFTESNVQFLNLLVCKFVGFTQSFYARSTGFVLIFYTIFCVDPAQNDEQDFLKIEKKILPCRESNPDLPGESQVSYPLHHKG